MWFKCRFMTLLEQYKDGEIECGESYFGPRRVKGKRGRGAGNKTIVFGLFKRKGKVYTHIVPNTKAETLLPLIRNRANEEIIVNTDLHLKECEFRFNLHGSGDVYSEMLKLFRENTLFSNNKKKESKMVLTM